MSVTITTVKNLVAVANGKVETMSAEEVLKSLGRADTTFVDVREGEEVAKTCKIAEAVHVPRGLLNFQADPATPSHT